jgi:hypothetical protein
MRNYEETIARRKVKYAVNFSDESIDKELIQFFNSGERIEVAEIQPKGTPVKLLRGTVGITTGWKPCFLLMKRIDSMSSDILLIPGRYEFVRVIPTRK